MLGLMELRFQRAIDRFPGWLRRLVETGADPSDPDELRVRKAVLVLPAGSRPSTPWFRAFVGLLGVSALIGPTIAASPADVPHALVVTSFALNIAGVAVTTYALLQYFVRARERAMEDLARQHEELE